MLETNYIASFNQNASIEPLMNVVSNLLLMLVNDVFFILLTSQVQGVKLGGGPKSYKLYANVTKNMPTILINSNEFLLGFSSKFDIKSIFIYNFVLIEKQKILSSKRGSYS